MKKYFSTLFIIISIIALSSTPVSALMRGTPLLASEEELGQLKVCKVAGNGVEVGQRFTINVDDISYNVPAGPSDGGYCVLAGQFPLKTQVRVQEVIPDGFHVARIEVKPSRAVSKDVLSGEAIIKIGFGVTEVIFTNKAGSPPPTPSITPTTSTTSTPRPTKTPSPTPECTPNCTPTPTPIPEGRLQICKETDDSGVNGYFTFNYGSKSVTVPAGACSSLLRVEAGSLTITEAAQAGIVVTDVYTIPAERLISKSLSNRSANVTIVEGYAASQTIVVFKNSAQSITSTPTNTPTSTATATITPTMTITPTPTGTIPPVCQPVVVTANFSQIAAGQSVEGLGVVAPDLNIDAIGTAVKIEEGVAPFAYGAGPDNAIVNGGIGTGGFGDTTTQAARNAHLYTFTFAPGISVSNFSLHMVDFGDLNPTLSSPVFASMKAYNSTGVVVDEQILTYTFIRGYTSPEFGDLRVTGDGLSALPNQPGNWNWNVSASGIARVTLEFGTGYDPNIGFNSLTFTKCQ